MLGVEIDKTIALDFTALRAVVDAVGGIDVTVDRPCSARYPRNDDPSVDAILATRRKVEETSSVGTLLGLLGALRDNVRTDLSVADMRALASFSKGYDDARTVRATSR